MTQLATLVELKRAATTINNLDRYCAALYTTTSHWTQGAGDQGTAALTIDALVDRIAHETEKATP